MKKILLLIGVTASYVTGSISAIWAIIEFILYLVKDREFNWWSVYTIIICIVSGLTLGAWYVFHKAQTNKHFFNTDSSRFAKRMEEMRKKNEQ